MVDANPKCGKKALSVVENIHAKESERILSVRASRNSGLMLRNVRDIYAYVQVYEVWKRVHDSTSHRKGHCCNLWRTPE